MTNRISKDEIYLTNALSTARRATCIRRQVGCILVDRHGDEISSGFNGPPRGFAHCTDHPCPGATAARGTGLEACEAIHAEQNALLQCRDVYSIDTVYCTDSPCVTCTKLLLNTSAVRIVYLREYPHPVSRELWTRYPMKLHGAPVSRTWEQFSEADRVLSLFDR
jgi:dCMP deaminase